MLSAGDYFHAPDRSVTLRSNSVVFGAVVGATVDIGSKALVHYDEALHSGCEG